MYAKPFDDNQFETTRIQEKLAKCEDIDDLKREILPLIKTQQEQWVKKIEQIISESGYSKSTFAKLCGISRTMLDKWCKGSIPRSRETFLRIGMVANYDIQKMNQLLQRYGRYPALYSKTLQDCVCIYVLNGGFGKDAIEKYDYILNRIKSTIIHDNTEETENISTTKFDAQLSDIQSDEELEQFIVSNIAMFSFAYHKFYAYVKMSITANYEGYADSVFELAESQGWSSSLRQCVSAIRQSKWFPTRNKIISLGLHLSMDHDQIDEMLRLAHMEPLCTKNLFESVIMFILDDASLNNMLDSKAENYDPDELCRYAKKVLTQLNLPELNFFISELSEVDDEEQL